ncbi:hypothetical protein BDN72DRAFT_154955 [Pluteus cervinus]|uniref:Uncharacterized protein n=1 Tax=Pluteus cervinus TaxID=181527 RepID=A0ACD3ALS7_9AGAR|nr:hypothetical protein BDN72DRAFT_154955 [Pluteus cervinus]
MVIPPGGEKPKKSSDDNTFIFCIMEGTIIFSIQEDKFLLTAGGMFMVPRGNRYGLENVGQNEARLFYSQARRVCDCQCTDTTSSESSSGSGELESLEEEMEEMAVEC